MPMEIDRLQQKGKGKESKGKGKDKAKGKSKDDKGKSKGKGGKQSGSGKGDQKGKDKETKGKGKGNQDVCWTRGRPGHVAKDCWRVRQIEIPAAQTTVPSSGQSAVSQTTTTTGDGNSSTGKAIRRVSQPLIFDLRQIDETSGTIRVLKETGKPKIEFYMTSSPRMRVRMSCHSPSMPSEASWRRKKIQQSMRPRPRSSLSTQVLMLLYFLGHC